MHAYITISGAFKETKFDFNFDTKLEYGSGDQEGAFDEKIEVKNIVQVVLKDAEIGITVCSARDGDPLNLNLLFGNNVDKYTMF